MAIDKPSLNNFLPNGFETQDKSGYKANFDADKIATGFDKDTLEVLSGPNLNNLLDKTGKNFNVLEQFLTFFRDMPIGSFPITNASNQLDYKSVNSFFRNVGELVFSAIPLEDGNLRLLDGSLLEYTMTYSRFITYIAGLRASLPNLFCTQAQFDQSVATYGVCGKFVYDSVTKSLRLPKISGFIKGTLDQGSLGNIDEAKAPNITGEAQFTQEWETWGVYPYQGAFYLKERGGNGVDGTHGNFDIVGFDASRSSSVYKDGVTTIEPQAVKEFIYMVVSIDEAEKQILSAVYNYKGSVENYSDLPTAVAIGEVYNVIGEDPEGYSGANFAWTGEEWDRLGGTVNLSGYLTKVEGANTYATKASLESNVEVLQQQINTNASNIANIASEEVIQEGIKKIEMLKFASTLGIGKVADTDLFATINEMKRSSFDINKFTVRANNSDVSNPTVPFNSNGLMITKDGIVSGCSNNNYLKIGINLDTTGHEIKIKGRIKITLKETTYNQSLFKMVNSGTEQFFVFKNSLGAIQSRQGASYKFSTTSANYTLNEWMNYEVTFTTDNKISLLITQNNTVLYDMPRTSVFNAFNISDIWIGEYAENIIYDFKQFFVEIDGKEVFNGNKQGMDIIKPTDFLVYSTMYAYKYSTYTIYADSSSAPTELYNADGSAYTGSDWTISGTDVKYGANTATYTSGSNITYNTQDTPMRNPKLPFAAGVKIDKNGIASGFSDVGYLNLSTIDFTKPWDFYVRVTPDADTPNAARIIGFRGVSDYNNIISFYGKTAEYFALFFDVADIDTGGGTLYFGETYDIHAYWTGSVYGIEYKTPAESSYTTIGTPKSSTTPISSASKISIGYVAYAAIGNTKVDLNSLRFYSNGELVVQPMLRIPYTLSNTGLKITNELDRAIDLAEQCGFSQYYGLDEQNMLCLVPQGENITGRRDLVSQEEDANHNVIEYYSDFYCKQSGSCTSGTAITFAQPYKDDNAYKLNVPYSAKSKTGFTPSASGDYTAEGHIYLT